MDTVLEQLRLENARLKKDRDQIIKERNRYLAQIQKERTSKAELSTKNTEMSNQLIALESEINDLKRTNQDLSEKLELALATADREPTASRASTLSSDLVVQALVLPKSKGRRSRAARKQTIVISDDEEDASLPEMKVEASSPTHAKEYPPQKGSSPRPNGLEESDNDDPFADDFESLHLEQQSSSRSSISGEDAADALRASGALKRKHNDEEEPEIERSPTPPPKPQWKPKAIDMKPYESISHQHLQSSPHFTVTPPAPTDFFFSRDQVNKSFGGQMYTFISTLKKSSSLNGRPIKCVWPENDLNPLIVSRIGAPGLMFASRHEILHDPPWYVFSKRKIAGKARWEYCGSYETTNVGNIGAEEFKGFPRNVQTSWGDLISGSMSRTQPVYVKMRVRIGLRKFLRPGETITESRVDREADIIFKSKKSERKGVQVTSEDVIRALSAGEEHLNILRMRCVGYDHAFVDDLKRNIEATAPEQGPATKRQRESTVKESTEELQGVSSQEQPTSGVRRSNRERKPRTMAHDEELSEDDW